MKERFSDVIEAYGVTDLKHSESKKSVLTTSEG